MKKSILSLIVKLIIVIILFCLAMVSFILLYPLIFLIISNELSVYITATIVSIIPAILIIKYIF